MKFPQETELELPNLLGNAAEGKKIIPERVSLSLSKQHLTEQPRFSTSPSI